jgi:hypothetical protein
MVLYSDNGQRYTYVTDAQDSPMVRITAWIFLVALTVSHLSQL